MKETIWETPFWPEGVAHTVTDYHFPLFKFLDDSARVYPNKVFTVFNGASKTFAQVKAIKGTKIETVVVCNIKSYLPKLKGFRASFWARSPRHRSMNPAI